ncbi:DUF3558 domain-containing protein [Streptomyces sp. NPDC050145]|uniref:DUF3558 domain-containing protein n=1 Tax=Streptomyces sp. NPDC050145 TaxID=3365602 RepID=UPI00378A3D9A
MQRKSYAYVPGVAVLLTALLAGCTGSPDSGDGADDSKPGEVSASASAAKPGRYRTLPEPCAQPERATLDGMLPGIAEVPDQRQREKAYEGTASATYDTDRRVGCSWKDDSAEGGVHRLTLDFERVVSYDARVSDDARAEGVYVAKAGRAGLEVTPTESPEGSASSDTASPDSPGSSKSASASASESPSKEKKEKGGADASSGAPSADEAELGPRLLGDLGDEAFLNDVLAGPEAAQRRTVTVVFRTSNALVTVEYEAQSALSGEVPDSKEMQDTARELAQKLVGKFGE